MVVNHINSKDIYHRDLKPENFLIKRDPKGRILLHLNDFGLAKSSISDSDRISTTAG
jgi:serine/threonine protein kinase